MANRLASATSPYLLQHADNPVDWWQWGPEAFAEARRRDVPVLLSVGYAACHWCHVMAHESFEDEATAAYMNEHFVSIKVDREERPDVDAVYMQATTAMTGQGGWPMTVVLDPGRRAVLRRHLLPGPAAARAAGLPAGAGLVERRLDDRRAEVVKVAGEVTEHLLTGEQPLDADLLAAAGPVTQRRLRHVAELPSMVLKSRRGTPRGQARPSAAPAQLSARRGRSSCSSTIHGGNFGDVPNRRWPGRSPRPGGSPRRRAGPRRAAARR